MKQDHGSVNSRDQGSETRIKGESLQPELSQGSVRAESSLSLQHTRLCDQSQGPGSDKDQGSARGEEDTRD